MKTPTDIGIDVNDDMEILVPRGSELPCEFECEMECQGDAALELYEGNRVHVEDNYRLVSYHIEDIKRKFLFKIIVNETDIQVYIDEKEFEPVPRSPDPQRLVENALYHLIEDSELRRLADARSDYRDYVYDTLRIVEDDDVKMKLGDKYERLHSKLEQGLRVLDVDDVTSEEFIMALQELEGIVNLLMKPIKGNLNNE